MALRILLENDLSDDFSVLLLPLPARGAFTGNRWLVAVVTVGAVAATASIVLGFPLLIELWRVF
jgi:hypothetical protein